MKKTTEAKLLLITIILISVIMGVGLGSCAQESDMKQNIIDQEKAVWGVNPKTGKIEFQWK
jgi:hypothetical protein